MKRKLIGLITANPEAVYQQHVMEGVFSQCVKYGYDVAVFAPLMQACSDFESYLNGEVRIFDLIDFDRLDGVFVATISLAEANTEWVRDRVAELIKEKCSKPVVAFDLPLGDLPAAASVDDAPSFEKITAHLIDNCGRRNIYYLGGQADAEVTHRRLRGIRNELERRGMELRDDHIFYGNFWYNGGEELAEKIISGEVPMPDAVICANDHMAIGLVNKLLKNGINVPRQISVTGFDATHEAALNELSITTYIPDISMAAAEGINILARQIDPDAEIIPALPSEENGLRVCASCGGKENITYIRKRLYDSLFNVTFNPYDLDQFDDVNIGRWLDSYMLEKLTRAADPEECLREIGETDYLLKPYKDFYLCLNENWLTALPNESFSRRMKNVIHSRSFSDFDEVEKNRFCSDSRAELFDVKLLHPEIDREHDEPLVYYFSSIHFLETLLGYAVLVCPLAQKKRIGIVYRNWVRNVNSALEMTRVRTKLTMYSEFDAMTGLMNRRGMEHRLKGMLGKSPMMFACVLDMDGLKYINDNFGHAEGDNAIIELAHAARSITMPGEICIRAGGDEFFILGSGTYTPQELEERLLSFLDVLNKYNETSGKPYNVMASAGFALGNADTTDAVEKLLHDADTKMYDQKVEHKRQRKN
ncbi:MULTISPECIES: GGDEF domain-containing protein [unclassified Ruminococcus]|uniref:diguanylate cyclase domain-containing protein n=1 Tax=unclassified Ruminococcus TaxID=2608920 RepID=UPI001585F9AC|nr:MULTISPECIES: GGDEF domain-containing protein [unclassified Ruminococcus]